MAKTTAKAQLDQLYLDGQVTPVCTLDSPAWFAWLETAMTFRYFFQQRLPAGRHGYRPLRPISVRKEKRRCGYLFGMPICVPMVVYTNVTWASPLP